MAQKNDSPGDSLTTNSGASTPREALHRKSSSLAQRSDSTEDSLTTDAHASAPRDVLHRNSSSMAQRSDSTEGSLTTDAHPSPPRDDLELSSSSMAERSDSTEDNSTTDARPSSSRDAVSEETEEIENEGLYKPKKKSLKKTESVTHITNISNSSGIHIGNVTTINMGKEQKTSHKKVVKTVAITKLLEQSDLVSVKLISFVSQHIGDNWRSLARILDYSDGEIHQFYEKNIIVGVHEVVYQILLDWIQNKPEEAKVGTLATALWNAPEKKLVKKISKELPL